MLATNDQLQLRPIRPSDKTNNLSLGKSNYTPLKTFLRKEALNFHEHNIAKTYVLTNDDARIWGYITLMNSEIKLDENQQPLKNSKYDIFPAVKIARLAVDQSLQKKGYGKGLLEWTITLIKDKISPQVGCRFLVVDAKKDSISFYENAGFILFNQESSDEYPLMFLDLYHIQ